MAVKLRMRRMGSRKRPFYRIVAADSRFQRDGRFLEILGYYDPKQKPFKFQIDREKVKDWLQKGAQMSGTVESLLRKEGIFREVNETKIRQDDASPSNKKEDQIIKSEEEKPVEGEVEQDVQ